MGRPRSKPRPFNRATSLDYLNGTKKIDPGMKRNTTPYLPGHARKMIKKLKDAEEQLKELERDP